MDAKSTRQVAELLGIHPSRIEQAISRKQFVPTVFPREGFGRMWPVDEVLRLIVFFRLVDLVGIDPSTAGLLTQTGVYGFKDDRAWFVAYHGHPDGFATWHNVIVRERDLGSHLASQCEYPKVLQAGYSPEAIKENSRKNLGTAHAAILLNLDEIENDLMTAWGE